MAVRRPRKVQLPETAYTDSDEPLVPDYLAELETIAGRCYSPDVVVMNCRGGPGLVCTDCAMAELDERWSLFKARTNAGIPKAKYYRDLDNAQSRPDPEFARQQRWARDYLKRYPS